MGPGASSSELTLLFRVHTAHAAHAAHAAHPDHATHASGADAPVDDVGARVSGEAPLYGCAIGQAQEIVTLRPMTRLPGAPRYVRGLINMRGLIVTVLDLACRLDPLAAPATRGAIVLVRHRSGGPGGASGAPASERVVGVVVGEVVDVRGLDIRPDEVAAPGGIVRGVATHGDAPVVVLDLEALVRQVLLS